MGLLRQLLDFFHAPDLPTPPKISLGSVIETHVVDNLVQVVDDGLDYDEMIHLDAEEIAEQGIVEAYEAMRPSLEKYIQRADEVEEIVNIDVGAYTVRFRGQDFVVYSPELGTDGESWGRATYVLFHIINEQLKSKSVRLYAFYGGNDLGGMFLNEAAVEKSRSILMNRRHWPFIPELESPWYGQYH
jgi:hypothetical protein